MSIAPVIAIIDDESAVRAALASLVSSKGYRVETYSSAEQFIDGVAMSEASCLVVDVQLQDLSGVELTRHLTTLGYTFPIIFITGSDDQSFQKQAMELDCLAYLLKPVVASELLEAIADAVGRAKTP